MAVLLIGKILYTHNRPVSFVSGSRRSLCFLEFFTG